MNYSNILFDPHCERSENLITSQVGLPANDRPSMQRLIMIPHGPVFLDTLSFKYHDNTPTSLGRDYAVGHVFKKATHNTGRVVVGSIFNLKRRWGGGGYITGHSLGGEYVMSKAHLDNYVANATNGPEIDTWETVMGGDPYFPPVSIKFDIDNWCGEPELMASLKALATTRANIDSTDSTIWIAYNNIITQMQQLFNNSGWQTHLNVHNNPHNTKWWKAGALHKDGYAVNTLKAYGQSLQQLSEYVISHGVNATHLTPYIQRKVNTRVTGNIVLKDNTCVITGSDPAARTVIDLSTGSVKVYAHHNVVFQAASAQLKNTAGTLALAGGGQSSDALTLNGVPIINTQNLSSHNPPRPDLVFNVITENTPSVRLTGSGTTASPLSGDVIPPVASETVPGYVKIASAIEDSTDVATPNMAHDIDLALVNKIPTTRRINNKQLTGNVTITKVDINLGNVNNTSDLDKPLSSAEQVETAGKSPKVHTHPASDFSISNATETKYGVATQCVDFRAGAVEDTAIAPRFAREFNTAIVQATASIDERVPSTVIDAKKFIINANGTWAFSDDGIVTTTDSVEYYYKSNWNRESAQTLDLKTFYPKPWTNHNFYIYATMTEGSMLTVKDFKWSEDKSTMLVATVTVRNGIIVDHHGSSELISMGRVDELIQHIIDKDAHNFPPLTKEMVGLGNVVNMPTCANGKDVATAYSAVNRNKYLTVGSLYDFLQRRKLKFIQGIVQSGSSIKAPVSTIPYRVYLTPANVAVSTSVSISSYNLGYSISGRTITFIASTRGSTNTAATIEYIIFYN